MEDFEKMCHQEYQTVQKFLLRLSGNAALAEELTQETFYQAMRKWKTFRNQCAVSTWLCGIAKNLFYTYCRKPRPAPIDQVPEKPGEDFVDTLLDKEQRLQAHRLLHSLPEPYREVVTLRTFGELTHQEIGTLFGKPERWARVTYYRDRQMLVRLMKGEEIDE